MIDDIFQRGLHRVMATLLVVLYGNAAFAAPNHLSSSTEISLEDVLSATHARQRSETSTDNALSPFSTSKWIAALPSIAISYMQSDEAQGTDETEINLSLPIKSPYLAKQDRELQELDTLLAQADQSQRMLFLSGLIREALWAERIAVTRARYTKIKITQLATLHDQQKALLEARSANRYSSLLLRQELADARLLAAEQALEVAKWRDLYQQFSGLSTLPKHIDEAMPSAEHSWQQHPSLRWLELKWRREQTTLAATSTKAQSWDIALQARQLDSPVFKEEQYGIAIDIPLSVFDIAAASSNSDWSEASRRYWRDKDALQLQLKRSWQTLQGEGAYLRNRQALLEDSSNVSRELLKETRALMSENELAKEIWLRRVLADLDRQAESAINQLLIGQNRAMSRQAAGIPL